MSKLVKGVIGAAFIVVGAVVPGLQPLLAVGLSLVSSAVLTPKTNTGVQERQASETVLQLGETPRQVAFGTIPTGPTFLDPA